MIPQNIIITFSRKMMEYQRAVRERQVERARRLAESKDPEEVKKVQMMYGGFSREMSERKMGKS